MSISNRLVNKNVNLIAVSNKVNLLTAYRGEKGDPGTGGSVALPSLIVTQSLSALRIVSNINGQYDYANSLDPISVWSIVGITLQAINVGGLLTPVNNQPVIDQSWNWVRGSPVFLGPLGTLTQTSPLSGYLVTVARVLDSKTLFINTEDVIKL